MGSRQTISLQSCSRFSTKSDFIHQSAIPQFDAKAIALPNAMRREQRGVKSEPMEASERLACGVAHDFNNLLTGIMLYSDLLIAGLESNSQLRGYAEEIRRVGLYGASLMQRLATVARPELVEIRVLSWNEVVTENRNFLARTLGDKIELITTLACDLGYAKIDPTQLQRILLNLVLNARDAMPQGGRVTLETRNSADCLRNSIDMKSQCAGCIEFAVTDTGCGMDVETRSHLFEPFFTTKSPGHGTGLGLVTVNTIVKQNGGMLRVESRPGKGTRVTVRLPRVAGNPQKLESPSRSFASQDLTVVVADIKTRN
jgi:two-component system, cell cycle sensor histidine kinase and response regulator CckA